MFESVESYVGDLIYPTGFIAEDLRRAITINDTKIQYLSISDKLYKVTNIDFSHFSLEAREIDLSIDDVPESELWDISELGEFKIRLVNNGSKADVIDMAEWRKGHGMRE